ncbi:MAG: nucleoside hydrolase [Acidobacteriales bacterium]|nr:nucleoside hydrolase [Candidatus Koribacter versatilis]MBI3646241.1 nucleoside hydrolase [Terriglobales bacterium]
MKSRGIVVLLSVVLMLAAGSELQAQQIKVIVDQDSRGPATTDMQSILIFLQSDKFDVLGITTVSGDQWVKEETQRTLRLVEIAGRTDVPVVQGAEFPLLNSKEETERWEALYGKLRYKGCWSDFSNRPASTPPAFRAGYHEPDVVPPLVEGAPHTKALDETAAHFIVRMVRKYPGEVVVWAGGPLTNIALALRLDPEVATLAKELVLMGSGMYADNGGIGGVDARREFNWWFDPEAVRITMRAPWKKITITPVDVSVKTKLGPEIQAAIAKADAPVARYLTAYSVESFMWDELSAAAMVDPSLITGQKELYVDIDIDHGPSYGQTLFWSPGTELPSYARKATVQFDVDAPKLYDLYIKLMTLPPRKAQ